MAKEKKEKTSSKDESEGADNYEKRLPALLPFASPLAPKKLNKKVLKTVKKGMSP
jgi:H/ACA ribonucleoprotein complex subunit 2